MKVLFLHPSGAGGAGVSLSLTIRVLTQHGFDCTVAGGPGSLPAANMWETAGAHFKWLPNMRPFHHARSYWSGFHNPKLAAMTALSVLRWPKAREDILELIRTTRPDIVYCNTIQSAPYGRIARHLGIPTVLHIREPVANGYFGIRRALLRNHIARTFDHVFFITEFEQKALGFTGSSSVVFNWVETSHWPQRTPPVRAKPTILHVGGPSHLKGGNLLLRAILQLEQRMPGRFDILLPGFFGSEKKTRHRLPHLFSKTKPERDLARKVRRMLGDRFRASGWVNNTQSLFFDSDIVVFPATVDHFGRPLVEAAAASLPSIASDFPETRVVVRHEVTGLLVRPGDKTDLVDALEYLINNPPVRTKMGLAARAVFEDKFTEKNGKQIVNVLHKLQTDISKHIT